MQNHYHYEDVLFDNNKYHFPPDTLTPSTQHQPWLEVAPVRDEQGTPGLQPIPHDEYKYADVIAPRGMQDEVSQYRTPGIPYAVELTSEGMQAVPIIATETRYPARSQPQPQPQYQWPNPNANHSHGQSFQTLPSSHVSGYSSENLVHGTRLAPSNGENQYPNPDSVPSTSSPRAKDESRAFPGDRKHVRVKRWVVWVAGGAILILVIIGAVLGGVLGSRVRRSGHNTETVVLLNTTNGTSSNHPTSAPIPSVRTGSRLAVTGYRSRTDYSMRLFYQDRDRQLRFVDRESAKSNWSDSTILNNLPYQPMTNGSIAAGSYLFDDPVPKIEFFYEDKNGLVRGQNFNFKFENGKIPVQGEPGSINTYPLQTAGETRISCYFPYIISQDADNSVRWTALRGQDTKNLSAPWWVNDTDWDIKASKGGAMVLLPIAQKYENAGGIVYRTSEGMLSIKIHDGLVSTNDGVAWRKGALSKSIPADTSIGAFSVGRPYDNNNQVNTYILYQEKNSTIQVIWQDDDTGWKGPQTYDALDGAEQGTDIACLTPAAYGNANIGISREQDMNRCFFQVSGGGVKEVWFDGSVWHDVGIVPMS